MRGGWIEKIAVGSAVRRYAATVQLVKCFRDGDPIAATATAVAAVEDSAVEHLEVELLMILLLLLLLLMVMCLEGVTVSLGGRTSSLLRWDVVAECGESLGEAHVLATAPTTADRLVVKILAKHRRNCLRRRVDGIVGGRCPWWEPR
jgi:hypothetical protein